MSKRREGIALLGFRSTPFVRTKIHTVRLTQSWVSLFSSRSRFVSLLISLPCFSPRLVSYLAHCFLYLFTLSSSVDRTLLSFRRAFYCRYPCILKVVLTLTSAPCLKSTNQNLVLIYEACGIITHVRVSRVEKLCAATGLVSVATATYASVYKAYGSLEKGDVRSFPAESHDHGIDVMYGCHRKDSVAFCMSTAGTTAR